MPSGSQVHQLTANYPPLSPPSLPRSLPGANVLVNEMGVCKLADFGASKQLDGSQTRRLDMSLRAIRGTVPYMAPEGTCVLPLHHSLVA